MERFHAKLNLCLSGWIERVGYSRRILYLNITRRSERRINAILFVITDDELRTLDEREWVYDREAVDDDVRGVAVANGHAWAFVRKPEHISNRPETPHKAAIRRSYLDIIDTGVRELGADFKAAYENSTDPAAPELVIRDHKLDRSGIGA